MNAVSDLLAAVLGRFGHVGRARGRANIRQDLDLLKQLREAPEFGSDSEASSSLTGYITAEVAHYSGAEQGKQKPWASVALAAVIGVPLGYLAYRLSEDGFDWFSVPAGIGAALMLLATIGMLTGDDDAPTKTSADKS